MAGAGYADVRVGQFQDGIEFLDVGGFRSEWRTDFILFSNYGLRSEYYHPFTPLTHWFVAPRALIESDPYYLYENNKLVFDTLITGKKRPFLLSAKDHDKIKQYVDTFEKLKHQLADPNSH